MKHLLAAYFLFTMKVFASNSEITCVGVDSSHRSLTIKIQEEHLLVTYKNSTIGSYGIKPYYSIYKYQTNAIQSEFWAIQTTDTPSLQFHIHLVMSKNISKDSRAKFYANGKYHSFKELGSAQVDCKMSR